MIDNDPTSLLNKIAQAIYDKKGVNILALDVRGVSSMTDFFLIAEGNVERHVKALANAVLAVMKEEGIQAARVEGVQECDWVVIDCWNVVVHLFTPPLRGRYQLERLWQEAEIVDLELETSLEEQYG